MHAIADKLMDILGDVFAWLYEAFIEPFLILTSLHKLIFGEGEDGDLVYNTFTTNELENIYGDGSIIMSTVAGFFILGAIIIAGMRISSAAINPGTRTYYLEFLKDLGIVTIIFFNLDFLYDMIFTLNDGIITVFKSKTGGDVISFSEQVEGAGILGAIFINIIVLFLTLWANWYYMMRKLTLLIFMVLGPLMIAFYLIPNLKPITGAWFKEFIGTVFVQSIHAILLWVTVLITAGVDPITSGEFKVTDPILNIEAVILYLIFIPTGEAIRSLLGMGGGMNSHLSKAGSMLGMSALAGIYGSVKGALDKNNNSTVMSSLKEARDGFRNTKNSANGQSEESIIKDATMAANYGTDNGTTPKADEMLKWGDIVSKGGKAVLGSAGAVGGAALGPAGTMIGSTMGYNLGGLGGGVLGRGTKALTDLINKNAKNGKNALSNTWNEMVDPISTNQEDLANKIAEKDTADYENLNKDTFIENAREKFPELDDKGLEMVWNDHKKDKHAGHLSNAMDLVKRSTSNDGKLANADLLAKNSAEELTNYWANDNEQAFRENYDLQNPLPENATTEEKSEHERQKSDAWNHALSSKRKNYQSISQKTANEMKNNAMGSNNISKEDFAKNLSANMNKQDSDNFVEEYQKQNPNATIDEAKNAFNNAKRNLAKENFSQAYIEKYPNSTMEQANEAFDSIKGASSKEDFINKTISSSKLAHREMAEKAYDTSTDFIKANNKDGFIEHYQTNINPSASNEQAGEVFNSINRSNSKQEFMKDQQFVPSEQLVKQAGNAYDIAQSQIDSGINKEAFVQSYKNANPNATKEQAEVLFDKANNMITGGSRSYLSATKNAVNGVRTEAVFDRGSQEVNRGYLTNQLAYAKTLDDKQSFVQNKIEDGLPEAQAQTLWKDQESKQFENNLSYFNNQLPQTLPVKQMVRKSDAMQKASAGLAASTAFITNATGIKPLMDSANKALIKGKMVTESFSDGYLQGAQTVLQPLSDSKLSFGEGLVTQTKAIGSGITQGIQSTKDSVMPSANEATNKLETFRNVVAYTGGLVGGMKLYQKSANFATRNNPYNKVINEDRTSGVYEASEIRQMASKKDDYTGETYTPPGNIKLVTTATKSYVQAIDSAGKERIVSRYGSGDSALTKGEIVYQDLNVTENGGLSALSEPYKLDTGGQKVLTGRHINVNPNKLIASKRSAPTDKIITQNVTPYNAKVDTGMFSKKDAIKNIDNIRMIVTKSRSYMVGNDKNTGQEVRISPYKKGDARLDANDLRNIRYNIKNMRFNVDEVTDISGNSITYTPTGETEDYLFSPTNQRYQKRRQFENDRFKKIGGVG